MGKVTDPALLAQLEAPGGARVSDPALLQQLDGPSPSSAAGAFVEHGANSALLGFGDEMVGGYKALAKKLLPVALGGAPAGTPISDTYREDRNDVRARLAAERADHPAASIAGDVAGGVAPALVTGGGGAAARGLSVAQRLLRGAGAGAAYGGASGLGNSDQEDAGGIAGDTLKGAGVGGAAGLVTSGLSAAAPAISQRLRDASINVGRRFLSGTTTSLSRAKPLADDAVEEAFAQGAISPLRSIHGAAAKLQEATENVGGVYDRVVKALEANGITGPEAKALARDYAARGAQVGANTMNGAVPAIYQDAADQLAAKPTDAAGRLALSQGEKLKQSLQDMARSAYRQAKPGEEGRALKDAASMMRQANEDAIDQGAAASGSPLVQTIAEGFVPVKQKLSRLIPAADAAELAAQRAQKNHAIGLKEATLAAGNPGKLLLAYLSKTRGTSTLASALHGAAGALEGPPTSAGDLLRRLLTRETQQQAADAFTGQ